MFSCAITPPTMLPNSPDALVSSPRSPGPTAGAFWYTLRIARACPRSSLHTSPSTKGAGFEDQIHVLHDVPDEVKDVFFVAEHAVSVFLRLWRAFICNDLALSARQCPRPSWKVCHPFTAARRGRVGDGGFPPSRGRARCQSRAGWRRSRGAAGADRTH